MLNPTPEKLKQFAALYIANGFNAVGACKEMGMKPKTARSNAHVYRRLSHVQLAEALRAVGLDEASQAQKLKQLREAQMPKWNPDTLEWDIFDNQPIQMEATKEINKILGAYPAEPPAAPAMTINVLVDIDL